MRKTKKELTGLLKEFAQKHGDQEEIFKKIEETYFKNKKQNFLRIVKQYKPQNINTSEFNQAYQYWRRLKEINVSEKENKNKILQKAQDVKDCVKNHFKNLTDLGGGDPELGREFEEKYLYG